MGTRAIAAVAAAGLLLAACSDRVSIDGPRSALRDRVERSTASWPTDWSNSEIDLAELQLGIGRLDPRDVIPPIDDPTYEDVTAAAEWLGPEDPGALVRVGDTARFHPLVIMTQHEIVNTTIDGVPVAVTYCPLCNSALTFDRRVDGRTLRFGVSGLLRQSDLVMWDDATTSLWQQVTGEAMVGELAGEELDFLSTAIVGFGEFAARFPDGGSLSRDTGFARTYTGNPYVDYSSRVVPLGYFDGEIDDRVEALERVVAVDVDGVRAAYPFGSVRSVGGVVNDEVGGRPVVVAVTGATRDALDERDISASKVVGTGLALSRTVDGEVLTFELGDDGRLRDLETGTVWGPLGRAVEGPLAGAELDGVKHTNEFWFSWQGFFPDGRLWSP